VTGATRASAKRFVFRVAARFFLDGRRKSSFMAEDSPRRGQKRVVDAIQSIAAAGPQRARSLRGGPNLAAGRTNVRGASQGSFGGIRLSWCWKHGGVSLSGDRPATSTHQTRFDAMFATNVRERHFPTRRALGVFAPGEEMGAQGPTQQSSTSAAWPRIGAGGDEPGHMGATKASLASMKARPWPPRGVQARRRARQRDCPRAPVYTRQGLTGRPHSIEALGATTLLRTAPRFFFLLLERPEEMPRLSGFLASPAGGLRETARSSPGRNLCGVFYSDLTRGPPVDPSMSNFPA